METIVSDITKFKTFLSNAKSCIGKKSAEWSSAIDIGSDRCNELYYEVKYLENLVKSIESYAPNGTTNCLTSSQAQTIIDKIEARIDCFTDNNSIDPIPYPFLNMLAGIVTIGGAYIITIQGNTLLPI